jgi:hypothetical protein
MSFRDAMRADRFDRFVERTLKTSTTDARPPAGLRRRLILTAAMPDEEDNPRPVPEHVMARALPGGYRDIQHRLARRSMVYISPFGAAALGWIS